MAGSRLVHSISLFLKLPFYRLKGNRISFTSEVLSGVMLRHSKLGKYTYIGKDCIINSAEIGNYTCIASHVQIGGMEHPYWDLSMSPRLSRQFVFGNKTIIGNDVWIAGGSIIRQGVRIGDGAVIGANSYVNKDVEPYTIVAGSPARVIKVRDCKSIEPQLLASEYWNQAPEKAKEILNHIKQNHVI